MTRSTKAHLSRIDVIEQEERDQQDMHVRAQRLSRFRAQTANKVWHQNPKTGDWSLIPCLVNPAIA